MCEDREDKIEVCQTLTYFDQFMNWIEMNSILLYIVQYSLGGGKIAGKLHYHDNLSPP